MTNNPDRPHKRTILVDFDGVLHLYTSPWTKDHHIADGPVPGAIPWLWRMMRRYDVVIYSTRCNTRRGRRAVRAWLQEHAGNLWHDSPEGHGIEGIRLVGKPIAIAIIDDRAFQFRGTFPDPFAIDTFVPWNRAPGALTQAAR